jgi:hypothetical protein
MYEVAYWSIFVLSMPFTFLLGAYAIRATGPSEDEYMRCATPVLLWNLLFMTLLSFIWPVLIPIGILAFLASSISTQYADIVNRVYKLLHKEE